MPKSAGQKRKALVLQKLLLEQTDEEHPLPLEELLDILEQQGITAERKSIYSDLESLRALGLDVQYRKGIPSGWFVASREFQLAELKLLVDAVQSCKFITRRKSDALIGKLEHLTNVHQAQQLHRQVYVERRIKTMNESIYYTIDKLHTALAAHKVLSFQYFEYNIKKEKVFRRGGARYTVHPYGLIWESENYYLVGWDTAVNQVRHYRVDKMSDLTVTCTGCRREPFDMASYARKLFGMFSGREERLRIRFENGLMGVALDRFGQDVLAIPEGDTHFTVIVDAAVSPQFFGWLFGLGARATLLGPNWAVDAYRSQLSAVLAGHTPPVED